MSHVPVICRWPGFFPSSHSSPPLCPRFSTLFPSACLLLFLFYIFDCCLCCGAFISDVGAATGPRKRQITTAVPTRSSSTLCGAFNIRKQTRHSASRSRSINSMHRLSFSLQMFFSECLAVFPTYFFSSESQEMGNRRRMNRATFFCTPLLFLDLVLAQDKSQGVPTLSL